MEKLRFAPLIRVSTEKQERQGESLQSQKSQILQYVKSLSGTIPESCWKYSGQEHATTDMERQRLDQLLKDSGKNLFDAVIVCDISRWARDNKKSKEGLETLRSNKIKFFLGTMQLDLYNPDHCYMLGSQVETAEYIAKIQSLKSINNRIHRARRGVPTAGLLPYGRTFDKKTETWGIDPDKKEIIQRCAERYLKGESLKTIAGTYNMDLSNLWTTLFRRSGNTWECRYKYGNIDETVILKIPPLLDEKTIEAIQNKGTSKRCWNHGEIKNHYLLGRMVFCVNCGLTMTGFTSTSGRRYYRHSRNGNLKCNVPKFVYADELENSVLIHLVSTLGDRDRINKAIEQATPDLEKVEALIKEKNNITGELKKITSQKNKIIDKVAEGLISDKEVKEKMNKLRNRETSISDRITIIESELINIPDQSKVKKLSDFGIRILSHLSKNPKSVFQKSFEWKQNLIKHAFGGFDLQGKRLGVYVDKTKEGWKFEIRGTLENTLLSLPLPDEYIIEKFNIDTEFQDIDQELKNIRSNISNLSKQSPCQFRKISQQAILQ